MRRLIVLFVLLVLLCGCEGTVTKKETHPDMKASVMEFEGHRYIVFQFVHMHGGGVEHDPDCPACKEPE